MHGRPPRLPGSIVIRDGRPPDTDPDSLPCASLVDNHHSLSDDAGGVKYLLVEQDNSYGRDLFESLAFSYRNLKSMGA